MTAGPLRRPAAAAALALLLGLVAAATVFWVGGGRWYVVRTPSMGSAAPVGTLVLTRPEPVSELRVGDVIAFHPPPERAATFTHRVVAVTGGRVSTRGDLNGANDPWRLTGHDIVGRAVVIAPGLGWLARALPLLAFGWLLVGGLTRRWFREVWRGPARLVGGALVVMVAALVLHPFVGLVGLATTTDAGGLTQVSAVSTGLLPERVSPLHGHGVAAPLDLRDGHAGVVNLVHPAAAGKYELGVHIHLHAIGWLLLVLACLAPLLWVLVVGFAPVSGPAPLPIAPEAAAGPFHRAPPAAPRRSAHGKPHALRRTVLVLACVSPLIWVLGALFRLAHTTSGSTHA